MLRRVYRTLQRTTIPAVRPDLERAVRAVCTSDADLVLRATRDCIERLPPSDVLDPLAIRSPGLRGFDWAGYLRASALRIAWAFAMLDRMAVPRGSTVVDVGSYFGNFSLALGRRGYRTFALDAYESYGSSLLAHRTLLESEGVQVGDTTRTDETSFPAGTADAVLCMGVVEHVPHTPRELLEALDRMLKPGGVLVLDTPNLASLENRRRMAAGRSPLTPIELQYDTAIPFEGHHREYTPAEIEWLLRRIGHTDVTLELFDYSVFGLTRLEAQEASDWRRRRRDPALREIVVAASRRPGSPG